MEVKKTIEAEQAKVMEEFEKKLIKAKKEEKAKHEEALKVTEKIEKQAQTTRAEEDSMKLKKVELEASLSEIETLIKNTKNDIANAKKQEKLFKEAVVKKQNKKKFKQIVKEEIADKEQENRIGSDGPL